MFEHLSQCQDYRSFLQAFFDERKRRNLRYSFRTFAKSLGISHSYLSEIIHGKKKLNLSRAKTLAAHLHLGPIEERFFLDLVEGNADRRSRDLLEFNESSPKTLSVFTHWSYMVVLELAKSPSFRLTPENASRALNVPRELCVQAIQCLLEGDFIELDPEGHYRRKRNAGIISRSENEIMFKYQEQLLDLVKNSIRNVGVDDRSMCSVFFPMGKNQFKKLEEKFLGLIHEIMLVGSESTNASEHDTIFMLSGQVVPVASFPSQSPPAQGAAH